MNKKQTSADLQMLLRSMKELAKDQSHIVALFGPIEDDWVPVHLSVGDFSNSHLDALLAGLLEALLGATPEARVWQDKIIRHFNDGLRKAVAAQSKGDHRVH